MLKLFLSLIKAYALICDLIQEDYVIIRLSYFFSNDLEKHYLNNHASLNAI